MRLICPSCGAVHSIDAWLNDELARKCLVQAAELPGPVLSRLWGYLALFRPGARGLRWGRVQRLLADLSGLIRAGYIQHARRVARPAGPEIWGQAMERMIDHPPCKLPLKNHNYLRAIVYDLADAADRTAEVARNAAERSGNAVTPRAPAQNTARFSVSPEELRKVWELKKKGAINE